MSWFLLYFKNNFLNIKGLSDASVVSLTRKGYYSVVHFLSILIQSLILISDEWFNAVGWSFFLFGILSYKSE